MSIASTAKALAVPVVAAGAGAVLGWKWVDGRLARPPGHGRRRAALHAELHGPRPRRSTLTVPRDRP